MSELQWSKSEWTLDDLEDKTVEFDFENCLPGYQRVYGNGVFQVSERQTGEISVNITVDRQNASTWEWQVTTFYLPEKAVRAIKRNPAESKSEFSCMVSCA
jgi:hypothetical protein